MTPAPSILALDLSLTRTGWAGLTGSWLAIGTIEEPGSGMDRVERIRSRIESLSCLKPIALSLSASPGRSSHLRRRPRLPAVPQDDDKHPGRLPVGAWACSRNLGRLPPFYLHGED